MTAFILGLDSKFRSRTWIMSMLMFILGTILAFCNKLTWEWIAMASIAFVGFSLVKVIEKNIIKKLSKDDVMILAKIVTAYNNHVENTTEESEEVVQ